MNSGSFSLEPISQDGVLVAIALALVAVLAILTVIGMLWGARLKRRRKVAEAEEEQRMEALRAEGVEAINTTEGTALPPTTDEPAAPIVESSPPRPATGAGPIADAPVVAAAPAAPGPGDAPLTTLKGLGPKIAARLGELGVARIDQLAWIDDAEAAALDAQMGAFQGRIERDRWREQARLLSDGDRAGYEAQFGKLG